MSIKIGDVDLVDSAINTEFRISVLEKVVDRLLRAAPYGSISPQDIERMRDDALSELQKKYPNAGLTKKPK
jgi:hypothetical protein